MTSVRVRLALLVAAAALVAPTAVPVHAQTMGQKIRMTAWAVSMSNTATGANAVLDIRVDKWSTDQERQKLISTFLEKGQDGLLNALQKVPVKGRISNPGKRGPDPQQTRLGWNLRFAMQQPGEDGGMRILIATDRYMTFEEVRNQPRTVDYPFTLFEIHIPKEGKGEGRGFGATQIKFDKKKNQMVLEQYSAGTLQLNEITVEAKT